MTSARLGAPRLLIPAVSLIALFSFASAASAAVPSSQPPASSAAEARALEAASNAGEEVGYKVVLAVAGEKNSADRASAGDVSHGSGGGHSGGAGGKADAGNDFDGGNVGGHKGLGDKVKSLRGESLAGKSDQEIMRMAGIRKDDLTPKYKRELDKILAANHEELAYDRRGNIAAGTIGPENVRTIGSAVKCGAAKGWKKGNPEHVYKGHKRGIVATKTYDYTITKLDEGGGKPKVERVQAGTKSTAKMRKQAKNCKD